MYSNQNFDFYNCKLSGLQLTLVIIISIFTFGSGWFIVYPLCKTSAFNRDINSQILIKKQLLQEIDNIKNQIKKIEENIIVKERKI